jgi:hypothetical protein
LCITLLWLITTFRMSDAGDNNVEVEATEVAEVSEAPRGKLSVEEALEVNNTILHPICASQFDNDD